MHAHLRKLAGVTPRWPDKQGLCEAKKTFAQARAEILAHLQKEGWKVNANLKVPHATNPAGDVRLWFKTQAVYLSQGNNHTLNGARSMWNDIREGGVDAFMKAVARWTAPEKKSYERREFWRPGLLHEEVDADFAKAHAATSPEDIGVIFDKLKANQTVWMAYSAVMGSGDKSFKPYTVGRRSLSKKYNVTSVSLLKPGTKAGQLMKVALMRRGTGPVSVALGDMAATLLGLYVPGSTAGKQEAKDPDTKAMNAAKKLETAQALIDKYGFEKGLKVRFLNQRTGVKYAEVVSTDRDTGKVTVWDTEEEYQAARKIFPVARPKKVVWAYEIRPADALLAW